MTSHKITYSIVIPVRNEEHSISPIVQRLEKGFSSLSLNPSFEIIFVNDHSTDNTSNQICALQHEFQEVIIINQEKETGKDAALVSGLRKAQGEFIVIMDGDLQNHPEDIPVLIKEIKDADMVCGFRVKRYDSFITRGASKIANFFRNIITGIKLRDAGCALKVFRSEYKDILITTSPRFKENAHLFYSCIFIAHKLRVKELAVGHSPRVHGFTKFKRIRGRIILGIKACILMRMYAREVFCNQ